MIWKQSLFCGGRLCGSFLTGAAVVLIRSVMRAGPSAGEGTHIVTQWAGPNLLVLIRPAEGCQQSGESSAAWFYWLGPEWLPAACLWDRKASWKIWIRLKSCCPRGCAGWICLPPVAYLFHLTSTIPTRVWTFYYVFNLYLVSPSVHGGLVYNPLQTAPLLQIQHSQNSQT